MKLGVKTFSDKNFLKLFEKDADFFELMAIETQNYDFVKEFSKPWVIHSQHERFGFNNADKHNRENNLRSIRFAINLANRCKSDKIIVHPGINFNSDCSEEEFISLIKYLNDKRLLVENLPINGFDKNCFGATPEDINQIIKKTGVGFCLDINHAIETALVLKKDYITLLKDFIKLKPAHYHLGGQKLSGMKTHLSFNDSELNLKEILDLLPEDANITLEVTTDKNKTAEDISIIKKFIS
ncbi:MAG: TIM barrel protein [Candidatus Pacearchaeota archaeon]